MSKEELWPDIRLLSFDLQTVEFAYAEDYTVFIIMICIGLNKWTLPKHPNCKCRPIKNLLSFHDGVEKSAGPDTTTHPSSESSSPAQRRSSHLQINQSEIPMLIVLNSSLQTKIDELHTLKRRKALRQLAASRVEDVIDANLFAEHEAWQKGQSCKERIGQKVIPG
ncbi:hypothetical protein F5880DRAFT_1640231 [Lentinula raphanica]|nr:hypothetical protein F5880DRAFT_1640231 [Lentinula raphanica]